MQHITTLAAVFSGAMAALLGLVMGSFLNCAGSRMAVGESFVKGRSHCQHCGHELAGADLIPVLSWLLLRGRCRYCGGRLSLRYPLSELITAFVYLSIYIKLGFSLKALELLLCFSLTLMIAFADLEGGIIPNGLICAGIVLRYVFVLLPSGAPGTELPSIVGGLSVSLPLLLLVLLAEKLTKRPMMGGGDIKLIFMLGLYFSWQVNLVSLVLACIFGIVFALAAGKRGKAFPFGPAIAAGWYCGMLFGEQLIGGYLSLF